MTPSDVRELSVWDSSALGVLPGQNTQWQDLPSADMGQARATEC